MKFFRQNKSGQTLIETLAALFILVMGVSAATGLAIFAFNSSASIVKQIIATGLAREGVEAVKNMRDSNWLADTLSVNTCYDFATGQPARANCYTHWLNQVYCIDPTVSSCGDAATGTPISYYLGFDSSTAGFWFLNKSAGSFGLNFDPINSGTTGFYSPGAGGNVCDNTIGRAEYCRKVVLTKVASAPYDKNTGPLLKVQVMVWWVDKKCPRAVDYDSARVSCRVELDTYLTNWKNY